MEIQAGIRIGPYVVEATIGQGGMGVVYRALDSRLNRRVAIKVLPEHFSRDFDRVRRFDQEAKAIAQLSHPNIVQIYDVGLLDNTPYLVMELLEGQSLRRLIEAGTLPVRRAVDTVRQVAEGLAAAHAAGIIHRDLKPENVFVDSSLRVKILDFGLAKVRSTGASDPQADAIWSDAPSATGESSVLGTSGYMAPEQIQAMKVDGRTDIFALGVILWELLTGIRPFGGDSAIDTLHAILRKDLPDLPQELKIPPHVERILRRCLEKEPSARFQTAKDLTFTLETVGGTGSHPMNPDARMIESSAGSESESSAHRSNRKIAYAVGTLLLVGILAGVWSVSGRNRTSDLVTHHRITAGLTMVQSARFSPDGRNIAYSATPPDGNGPLQIFMFNQGDPFPASMDRTGKLLAMDRQGEVFFTAQTFGTNPGAGDSSPLYRWRGLGTQPREWIKDVAEADVSPDGQVVAFIRMNGSAFGAVLECPPGREIARSPNWISCPRFDSEGKRLAYIRRGPANGWMGQIVVVDLKGRVIFESAPMEEVMTLAWGPGDQILFTTGDDRGDYIAACDLKGRIRVVLRESTNLVLLDANQAGEMLVFSGLGQSEFFRERSGSWAPLPIPIKTFMAMPSPDGTRIGLTAAESSTGENVAYVMDLDSGRPTRLEKADRLLVMSPDNQRALVLTRCQRDMYPSDVSLVSIPIGPGKEIRYNTAGLKEIFLAVFLPDMRRIGVVCGVGNRSESYVLAPDAAPRKILTPPETDTISDQVPLSNGLFHRTGTGWERYPWEGGTPEVVRGLEANDRPEAWVGTQRRIVFRTLPQRPRGSMDEFWEQWSPRQNFQVMDLDPATGKRRLLRQVAPLEGGASILPLQGSAGPLMAQKYRLQGHLVLVKGALGH